MFVTQSPFDVTRVNNTLNPESSLVLPWEDYRFVFVTKYQPLSIVSQGVINYVYTINLTNPDTAAGFNGFWGSEPFHFVP